MKEVDYLDTEKSLMKWKLACSWTWLEGACMGWKRQLSFEFTCFTSFLYM